jgi:two-component system sensor histidine kinase DesK
MTCFPRPPWRSVLPPGGGEQQPSTRVWPLAASAWLLLLFLPLGDALATDPSLFRLVVALIITAAVVSTYLWLILRHPFRGEPYTPSALRPRVVGVALLVVLTLGLYLAAGLHEPPWLLVFSGIAAGITLPTRWAAWAVAALTVVALGASAIVSRVDNLVVAPLAIALIGGSMVVTSRLLVTVGELRAAREELASLAVAEERLRFARDLHDLLGHSLSLIVLKAELAGRLAEAAPPRAAAEIRDVERVAREALGQIRAAVAGYRQPTLTSELEGAREILAAAAIDCRIEQAIGPAPAALDAVLAWTVREGVTNVIRHSRARSCTISITRSGATVNVEVVDDGAGPSISAMKTEGSGLRGLVERVTAHGGRVTTGSLEGRGFRLRVEIPRLDQGPSATPVAVRDGHGGPR